MRNPHHAFDRLNIDDNRHDGSRRRQHRSSPQREGSHRRSRSSEGSNYRRSHQEPVRTRGLEPDRGPMPRRHTSSIHTVPERGPPRETLRRSTTTPGPFDDDPHLAYGDIPPPLPGYKESEVRNLMSRANFLLDEANCVGHSATTMMNTLQKNPEAMAAVALTLAEIGQLVSKMSPAALASLRGAFPAIFALLASPQFLIAAGVGVGITIIAFGGYKIIRQIKARNNSADALNELEEIPPPDLSHIEQWRRAVPPSEATSIDGEFITPGARDLRRSMPTESGLGPPPSYKTNVTIDRRPSSHRRHESDWESIRSGHSGTSSRHESVRHERGESSSHHRRDRSPGESRHGSEASSGSRRSKTSRGRDSTATKKKKEEPKKKKRGLSLRRILFK
jgi:hypothetical protein